MHSLDRYSPRLPYLGLAFICLLIYGPGLSDHFMMDDHLVLFGQLGVEAKSFVELFTDKQVSFYRPVGHIPLWICQRLFGQDAFPYHVFNLLFYISFVWLVYRIIEYLVAHRPAAFLAAAAFALHPLNSMLVHYGTSGGVTVYIVLQAVALVCLLKYCASSGQVRFYALSLVCFAFGLLGHETVIMFPLYAAALFRFHYAFNWRKVLHLTAPFVIIAAAFIAIRSVFIPPIRSTALSGYIVHHFDLYATQISQLIVWYISRLVYPVDIVFLWSVPPPAAPDWRPVLILSAVCIAAFYLLIIRWKRGAGAFGLAMFCLGFPPAFVAAFAYFPTTNAMIEPHWFYFASIGFFVLLGAVLRDALNRGRVKVWYGLAVLVLIGQAALMMKYNAVWQSQESYARYWISVNPHNGTPFYWLGKTKLDEKKYDEAMQHFGDALRVPGFSNMLILTDYAYADYFGGERVRARQFLEAAEQQGANYSVLYYYLAQVHAAENNPDRARKAILTAIRLSPKTLEYRKLFEEIEAPLKIKRTD